MNELHLTRKDFRLEWFSGTGKGGQHRNKHQNCCRITHIDSGIAAVGTGSRSRVTNRRDAFNRLARRLIAHYIERDRERRETGELVRSYHAVRNEVWDRRSGFRQSFKAVVNDIGPMIEARRRA